MLSGFWNAAVRRGLERIVVCVVDHVPPDDRIAGLSRSNPRSVSGDRTVHKAFIAAKSDPLVADDQAVECGSGANASPAIRHNAMLDSPVIHAIERVPKRESPDGVEKWHRIILISIPKACNRGRGRHVSIFRSDQPAPVDDGLLRPVRRLHRKRVGEMIGDELRVVHRHGSVHARLHMDDCPVKPHGVHRLLDRLERRFPAESCSAGRDRGIDVDRQAELAIRCTWSPHPEASTRPWQCRNP